MHNPPLSFFSSSQKINKIKTEPFQNTFTCGTVNNKIVLISLWLGKKQSVNYLGRPSKMLEYTSWTQKRNYFYLHFLKGDNTMIADFFVIELEY